MRGTDSTTGKALSGVAHLRQSIRDILTTPLGSRVMRREYGSRLFDLVDNPLNDATLVEIFAATAEALIRWEPRLRVQRVQARTIEQSKLSIDLEAIYLPTGEPVFLDGLVVS
jgi:phage baseplate assembly protein W